MHGVRHTKDPTGWKLFGVCDRCGVGGSPTLTVYAVSLTMLTATWRLKNNWHKLNVGNYAVLDGNNMLRRLFKTEALANTYKSYADDVEELVPLTYYPRTRESLCEYDLKKRERELEDKAHIKQGEKSRDLWAELTSLQEG